MSGIDHLVCADDPLPLMPPLGARPDPTGEGSRPQWRRFFPGQACQVREMRNWLRSFLPECPANDDVLSVACELAANAVQHTPTGRGGWFGVEVTVRDHTAIRVAVADNGGASRPHIVDEPQREHGRGLRVVQALSASYGYSGGEAGLQVWAEIPWQGIPAGRA